MMRYNKGATPKFEIADKVWLEATNLNTDRWNKLALKRYGPFTVTKKISNLSYQLKLPPTWKIHPIFHVSLLTPYILTDTNPNATEQPLPPIMIDNAEEFEVESILRHRTTRGRLEFLVSWKGYPLSEATWEPRSHLKHAQTILEEYIKRKKL